MSLIWFWRGLRLLRYPALVAELSDLLSQRTELNALRSRCLGAFIHRDVLVQGWREGELRIASGVRIEKGTMLCLGDGKHGFGALSIAEGTWVGPYNNIRLAADSRVEIGRDCLISQFCSIIGANHKTQRAHRIKDQGTDAKTGLVAIGDDVWMGAGSTILPGVRIGRGAVIAANSVVTRNIPEFEIWGGTPAAPIRERI